jgi:hypothetical protein
MEPKFESQLVADAIGECSMEYSQEEDIFACAVQRVKGVSLAEKVPKNVPRRKLDSLSRDAVEEIREKADFDL